MKNSILKDWSWLTFPNKGVRLCGKIYNDKRFKDGTEVWTTTVLSMNLAKGWARTKNTLYHLGEQSE